MPPAPKKPNPKTPASKTPMSKGRSGDHASKSTSSEKSLSNSPTAHRDPRGTIPPKTKLSRPPSSNPSKWPGLKGWPDVWKDVHDGVLLQYYLRKDNIKYNLDHEDVRDIKRQLTSDMDTADLLQGTFDVGFLFERLEHALASHDLPAGDMYLHWAVVPFEWRITVCLDCHDSGRKESVVYVNLDSNRARCAYCGATPYFWSPEHTNCKSSQDMKTDK